MAAGLILAAAFTVAHALRGGALAWTVAGVSTLTLSTTRASPFLLLGAGAAVFLAVHLFWHLFWP